MTQTLARPLVLGAKGNKTTWPLLAVQELAKRGLMREPILDPHCGRGDDAIALAAWGKVVGIDANPDAILAARQKAQAAGINAVFYLRDPTRPTKLRHRFETAVDPGLLATLNEEERQGYIRQLARLVVPGGHVHVLCIDRLDQHDATVKEHPASRPGALGTQFQLVSVQEERFIMDARRIAWFATFQRRPRERSKARWQTLPPAFV